MPATDSLELITPLIEFTGHYSHQVYSPDKHHATIGLEFENELNLEKHPHEEFHTWPTISNWKYHHENSLRYYGFEHVSKPLSFEAYKKQVSFLFNKLRATLSSYKKDPVLELPFTNSIRTSVHVHFEVKHYSTIDLINFVCLYWILEPYLQHFCGSWRQGNLFCLRLRDSSYMKILLVSMLQNHQNPLKTYLVSENYRYGSVNFGSIPKFGTIEFRMMRGVSDENDAFIWIDSLEAIRKFALQFQSTSALKDFFLNKVTSKDLPELVLGKDLNKKYLEVFPKGLDIAKEIQEGWMSVSSILSVDTTAISKPQKKLKENKTKNQPSLLKQAFIDWDNVVATTPAGTLPNQGFYINPYQQTIDENPWLHTTATPLTPAITLPPDWEEFEDTGEEEENEEENEDEDLLDEPLFGSDPEDSIF